LQVTDNNGCVGKELVTVSLKDCQQGFYVPNAFTPNNDGKNDEFKPVIFGKIISYRFIIYNRFGQKVFESKEAGKGWNGAFTTSPQHMETFVWVCNYQFADFPPETKKGSVMLMR
jgi:gliding motility-associated-like protein